MENIQLIKQNNKTKHFLFIYLIYITWISGLSYNSHSKFVLTAKFNNYLYEKKLN